MARGSVKKRGRLWTIVFDLLPDPDTGKRRQRRESGFRTRKEAEAALTMRQREVDTGTALDPTRLTVAQFVDHWLDVGVPDVRTVTLVAYRRIARVHIAPTLGPLPLAKLNRAHVAGWQAKLLASGLAPRTVVSVRGVLVAALSRALEWRLIAENPAHLTRAPRVQAGTVAHWDGEAARRFMALAGDDPAAFPFVLALGTGLRRGELFALRWADIDLDRATILVRRTRVQWAGGVEENPPKSGKSRVLDLDPDLVARLRAHRRRQLEERLRHADNWRDEGYVLCQSPFVSGARRFPGGRPMEDTVLRKRWAKLLRRHDLPELTLHGLRHTHATLLLEQGVHPKMVQERLGHASYALTMDLYSHATPTLSRAAAHAIGAALAPRPDAAGDRSVTISE